MIICHYFSSLLIFVEAKLVKAVTKPAILKSLTETNLCFSLGMSCCWRKETAVFPIVPSCNIQMLLGKPKCGFCQLLRVHILIVNPRTGKRAARSFLKFTLRYLILSDAIICGIGFKFHFLIVHCVYVEIQLIF